MSQQNTPVPRVRDYLVQSVLVTIFCCLPFGIVAIVFASQVNAKLAVGDIAGAKESSANAKKWINISVIAYWLIALIWTAFIIVSELR